MHRGKGVGLCHMLRRYFGYQHTMEFLRPVTSPIHQTHRQISERKRKENRRIKNEFYRPKEVEPTSALAELLMETHDRGKAPNTESETAEENKEKEDLMVTSKLRVTYSSKERNKLELGVYVNDRPYDPEIEDIVDEKECGVGFTSHTHGRFGEEIDIQGTPNPRTPMSKHPCQGCGAQLHCQDPNVPGYLVSERFDLLSEEQLQRAMCQRCILLKKYNLALNVALTPKHYSDAIAKLKTKKGLVVIVLDVSDLPNSIYRSLPSLIGEGRDVYIVGNKVDILPKDAHGYLERTLECLQYYIDAYGFSSKFNVRHLSVVSAKTGYGIEDLITVLLKDWGKNGNVYMVGCTNVGKSSLFNRLLMSDYCKPASRNLISRATTSVWPGTTLNLLKFPVFSPKPSKIQQRDMRLVKDRKWEVEEEKIRRSKLKNPSDYKYAILRGNVGTTFPTPKSVYVDNLQEDEAQQVDMPSFSKFSPELEIEVDDETIIDDEAYLKKMQLKEKIQNIQLAYDQEARKNAYWCYDTPGVINPEQIINLLTPEELSIMLTERLIQPVTIALRSYQSIFIAGLGRIDYVKGNRRALFTVFCSVHLPIIIQDTATATLFYRNKLGSERLLVPRGDRQRLDRLPALVGKEFTFMGRGTDASAGDITLSSLGWVAVTPRARDEITVRAYTPGGHGMQARPSLLRFAVARRGELGQSGIYRGLKPLA